MSSKIVGSVVPLKSLASPNENERYTQWKYIDVDGLVVTTSPGKPLHGGPADCQWMQLYITRAR